MCAHIGDSAQTAPESDPEKPRTGSPTLASSPPRDGLGWAWDNDSVSKPTEQRPPQVSLASAIVMFASVLVLLTAWEQVASIGSLETQEAVDTFLAEPPFSSSAST